ncbi:MAG: hypothetical protein LH606_05785 [Cytophagaceae bacterium]|nr:hypothetical protein [Cytophagaceae bacterium]
METTLENLLYFMLSIAPVFALILLALGVSLPFMIRPERRYTERDNRYRA